MGLLSPIRQRIFAGIIRDITELLESSPVSGGNKTILDLGCGDFDLSRFIDGSNIYGLDNDLNILFSVENNSNLIIGDGRQLPFINGSLDGVIALLFFHSISGLARNQALSEMNRAVKRSGRLIILDFCESSSGLSALAGRCLALEERFCGVEHRHNYVDFMAGGGIEGMLRRNRLDYSVIKKYRLGNLALIVLNKT